jgi:hypothetical protein
MILGTLGSIGAAPVPYSSLVLIVSCSVDLDIVYQIVIILPQCEANMGFFFRDVDYCLQHCLWNRRRSREHPWSIGSLRTVTNVSGDAVVCVSVAHLCPIEEENMEDLMKAAHLDGTRPDPNPIVETSDP